MKSRAFKSKMVVGILAFGVIGAALAAHYGQFFCNNGCTLQGTNPDGDTVAFIASTVNLEVSRWNNGDTVEICNSSACVTYKMVSIMAGLEGLVAASRRARPGGGSGGGGGAAGIGGGFKPPSGGGEGGGEGTVIVGEVEITN